ncbi:MAG TPA: SpoIIE family protein phosphatase, partial [Turneriella sp.]|nr:SpoIIE family protein phosphatase [Turneriella sp.]
MRFNAQGGMVGVFENQNFSERAILLSSGDRVVFLTDGILEHENETGEMYGTHRLSELFSKTTTIRAEQVCDALIEDMRLFRPSQSMLDDDATVIVLDID